MSTIQARSDLLANIATIAAAIAVVGVLAVRQFGGSSAPVVARLQAGETIQLDGVEWDDAKSTLLLALNKDCVYCSASMPFYKRITDARRATRLIAVFPHGEDDARAYLRENDVQVADIRRVDFSRLNIRGTPTLALVDRNGVVTRTWNGQLNTAREQEVLEAIE